MTDPATEKKSGSPRRRGAIVAGAVLVAGGFLGAAGSSLYTWASGLFDTREPVTAVYELLGDGDCLPVVVGGDVRQQVTPDTALTSAWAYENGGAVGGSVTIDVTVQGTSETAVVLKGFEIIDLERLPLPDDPVSLSDCYGQGGELGVRYLQVEFEPDEPRVVAMPNEFPEDPAAEDAAAVEFPFTVSASEVEVFTVKVSDGTSPCLCAWRLALNWSSGGESGQLVLGGPDKIRTALVGPELRVPLWTRLDDGSWDSLD